MPTASIAREPDGYRDYSNRLLDRVLLPISGTAQLQGLQTVAHAAEEHPPAVLTSPYLKSSVFLLRDRA